MASLSLQDIFDELGLGRLTLQPQAEVAPMGGMQQPAPFDTSVQPGTAFGQPYGGTSGIPASSPAQTPVTSTGYTPQPRPDLARPLTKGPGSDMFADYRDVYSPAQNEQDPLAALMGDTTSGLPGFAPQPPPSRALSPQWAGGQQAQPQYGAGQAQIDRQAQHVMPTESEKALLRQSPAYARAIDRIHALDRLRGQKGF
jgi:hypothetical protein